jgi:hypothetical protein
MSTAASRRQVLAELTTGRRSKSSRSGWRIARVVFGGLAGVLLLLALGAGYWWWSSVNDPRVVAIVEQTQQLRERFFPSNGQVVSTGAMSQEDADEMVAAMTSIRDQMEQLPEHLRPVAGMQIGRMFFTGMQQQMDDFFATPPAERQAVLDQHIYQMEAMRTAFARNGSGPGGPPAMRSSNEGDRNEWRKRILDRTTPEQRARWTEYRDAVDKRRDELGLGNPWPG